MANLQDALNPGGSGTMQARIDQLEAEEPEVVDKTQRVIIVCNSLPLPRREQAVRGQSR